MGGERRETSRRIGSAGLWLLAALALPALAGPAPARAAASDWVWVGKTGEYHSLFNPKRLTRRGSQVGFWLRNKYPASNLSNEIWTIIDCAADTSAALRTVSYDPFHKVIGYRDEKDPKFAPIKKDSVLAKIRDRVCPAAPGAVPSPLATPAAPAVPAPTAAPAKVTPQ